MIPLRLYLYAGALIAVVVAIAGYAFHERGVQHQKDLALAQTALIAALKHNQEVEAQWAAKYRAAEDRHAEELAANAAAAAATPVPVVRVCHNDTSSRPVPEAPGPAESHPADAGSVPPGNAVPAGPGPDIGPSLDLLARSADTVVAACRALRDSSP